MKLKPLLLLLSLFGTPLAWAAEPLYVIKLEPTKAFEIVAEAGTSDRLSLYPLSETGAKVMRKSGGRKVVAADYEVGFAKIRTEDPAGAAQDIINQIGRQTGLMLRKHMNGFLARLAPMTLLQAFSDTAVITLLLTPKGKDVFLVTCSYVIDERPEGCIDGTPKAIAEMEKMAATLRAMNGDSKATSLPTKAALKDLKPEDFFRGTMMGFSSADAGGKPLTVIALMLRKGGDYTVGLYRNNDGTLTMLDQPFELHGTKSPYLTSLPADLSPQSDTPLRDVLQGLRADKLDGHGGYYLTLVAGRPVKKEF